MLLSSAGLISYWFFLRSQSGLNIRRGAVKPATMGLVFYREASILYASQRNPPVTEIKAKL